MYIYKCFYVHNINCQRIDAFIQLVLCVYVTQLSINKINIYRLYVCMYECTIKMAKNTILITI